MDSKLLATLIALVKKETGAVSAQQQKRIEAALAQFKNKVPVLETPSFSLVKGDLVVRWPSGLTQNLGNVIGPQGLSVKGDKGDKGDRGEKGEKGEQGVAGRDGKDGQSIRGPKGERGEQGPKGRDGSDGKDGRDGKDGKDGPQGPRGLQGLKGDRGEDGVDGIDGEDGRGIDKIWVDEDYHLKVRYTDNFVQDAGYVRGAQGVGGSKQTYSLGGGGGSTRSDKYVSSAAFDAGTLTLTLSDGSTVVAEGTASDVGDRVTTLETEVDTLQTNDTTQDSRLDDLEALTKSIRTTTSADQEIAAGVLTVLDYDTTEYTTGTSDFTVSADSRVTVLNAGVYNLTCGTVIEAQVGALDQYGLALTVNGDVVAASGSYATLAVGDALPLSASTQVQLSANDIVDARIQVDQAVNGVGNGLVRRLRVLFGATATQVNHLAITRVG